jgi:hypothetical protein
MPVAIERRARENSILCLRNNAVWVVDMGRMVIVTLVQAKTRRVGCADRAGCVEGSRLPCRRRWYWEKRVV